MMFGRQVSVEEEKIVIVKGLAKTTCENLGGKYLEIDGKPMCIFKKRIGKDGLENTVKDFNVEVYDGSS